jgi:hypothetical protein
MSYTIFKRNLKGWNESPTIKMWKKIYASNLGSTVVQNKLTLISVDHNLKFFPSTYDEVLYNPLTGKYELIIKEEIK